MSRDDSLARECVGTRELVAWYPSGTLSDAERQQVETHVQHCTDCADLHAFATRFQESLAAAPGDATVPHPSPDMLVRFVEQDPDLVAEQRHRIAEHLRQCAECAEEAHLLGQVAADLEQESETDKAAATGVAADRSIIPLPLGTRLRRGLDAASRSWLGPVPAACFMAAAAVLAIVLFSASPPSPDGGVDGNPLIGPFADGVALLADGEVAVRGDEQPGDKTTVLVADRQNILLLEFTDLVEPPAADARFRLTIRSVDTEQTVWQQTLTGASFLENYTLAVVLPPTTLTVGSYELLVLVADDTVFFRSQIVVQDAG